MVELTNFLGIEFFAMDANTRREDAFNNIFFAWKFKFKPNHLKVYGWINNKEHTKWGNTSKTDEKINAMD